MSVTCFTREGAHGPACHPLSRCGEAPKERRTAREERETIASCMHLRETCEVKKGEQMHLKLTDPSSLVCGSSRQQSGSGMLGTACQQVQGSRHHAGAWQTHLLRAVPECGGTPACAPSNAPSCTPCCSSARHGSRQLSRRRAAALSSLAHVPINQTLLPPAHHRAAANSVADIHLLVPPIARHALHNGAAGTAGAAGAAAADPRVTAGTVIIQLPIWLLRSSTYLPSRQATWWPQKGFRMPAMRWPPRC